MPLTVKQLQQRARRIKLLLTDVDGVLTDGRIFYLPAPSSSRSSSSGIRLTETKGFDSRDGLGFRMAARAGLKLGFISGRSSPIVQQRARELKIDFLEENVLEKIPAYERVLAAARVTNEEVAYLGDDIVDLPILKRVGLAVGVSSGMPVLRKHVHYWTQRAGGHGALREVVDLILDAQGKLDDFVRYYLGEGAAPGQGGVVGPG